MEVAYTLESHYYALHYYTDLVITQVGKLDPSVLGFDGNTSMLYLISLSSQTNLYNTITARFYRYVIEP